MTERRVAEAVSAFGGSAKAKLSNAAATGQPEDQLRGPLEALIHALAEIGGLPERAVALVGETRLGDMKTRPDFAVSVHNALAGFIEVKAPGKGADPRRFRDPHDKAQWEKLKSLPNLLYTDGNAFSLWRDGEIQGTVVRLDGDVVDSGRALAAPGSLLPLIADFLTWTPTPPKTAKGLADVTARLCRLLRDEVVEQLARGNRGLTALAEDWRKLLFPDADDERFADGYAQAVTFGLLVAKARDIGLKHGIHDAAHELIRTNSLIGAALALLTDDTETRDALGTSLKTLVRVLDEVNWHTISKDKPEAWLYFYEEFLEIYDNRLRKRTGSYYTPPEVVEAMVRLCDEVLCGPLFERSAGFASSDVTVADPAVGTGTFLLGVLRRIAITVTDDQGPGAVRGAIEAAASRIIGFEVQFGPFAVAQLRLIAEMQALMATPREPAPKLPPLKLFVTDTLSDPFVEEDYLPLAVQAIAQSRRDANAIKIGQPITVVIGNPPYKEKAEGRGGWVEKTTAEGTTALLDLWQPPRAWGVGAHAKHLRNLYIYFWRWAAWKVFGSGHYAATGLPERDQEGIVCFITVAGFLNGPGFQKMREDLRRSCSEILVIDCSPEGHQPAVATRIFQGVQQPVCIVLAARKLDKSAAVPARVRFRALPPGRREEKFKALAALRADDAGWVDGPTEWRGPFLPAATGLWAEMPGLSSLFDYDGSGVMPGRTWVIAPDGKSLGDRWNALVRESDVVEKEKLFYPHGAGDRSVSKVMDSALLGPVSRRIAVKDDRDEVVPPIRYLFRSFDRQWIIPDKRLVNRPNPFLWRAQSHRQTYITAPSDRSPTSGPALTLGGLIPDLHHYNGRGGRVYPLWRDRAGTQSNIKPALLGFLAKTYGRPVTAEDAMAYVAALLASPAYTARFAPDLVQPGLRVPLTAEAPLFAEAVTLGREVIWLHTYGERFADPEGGRPKGPPRLPRERAPRIPADGEIPSTELPEEMSYDAARQRLIVGKGHIDNVTPAMWSYEVSGKQVVPQWFSYRRRDRTRPIIGDRRPPSPLDSIQPDGWLAEYTSDLLDLLNVLGRLVDLEPRQGDLLDRVCAGRLITAGDLRAAGVIPAGEDGAADDVAPSEEE